MGKFWLQTHSCMMTYFILSGMMIDLVLKRPQKLIRPGTAMDNTTLRTEVRV